MYGTKGLARGTRQVTLPAEFQRLIRAGTKVLLVEDLVSTGSTLNLLIDLVEQRGAHVVGVGCLWRRTSVELDGKPVTAASDRSLTLRLLASGEHRLNRSTPPGAAAGSPVP